MAAVVMGIYGMHLDPTGRVVPFKVANAIFRLINHPALNLGLLVKEKNKEKYIAVER